jgi:hypothetical protein
MFRNFRALLIACGFFSLVLLLSIGSQISWSDPKDKNDKADTAAKELAKARADLAAAEKSLTQTKQMLTKTQGDLKASQQVVTKTRAELVASQKEAAAVKVDLAKTKTDLLASQKGLAESKLALSKAQKELTGLAEKEKQHAKEKIEDAKKGAALLNAKQAELALSQAKLKQVEAAQKDLRAELVNAKDLQVSAMEMLGLCFRIIIQNQEDAEARARILRKTQLALAKVRAEVKKNQDRLTTVHAALSRTQGELGQERTGHSKTKNELASKDKLLTETQKDLLRTRVQLEAVGRTLKQSATAHAALRKRIRDQRQDRLRRLRQIRKDLADIRKDVESLGSR